MKYDAIIIGAGLSGLAAGIRLSHYGKKVVILEKHFAAGGLNSYYKRGERMIDVGLHAMTNFVPEGTRGAPLTKLLRQLRIKHSELELVEQKQSAIVFNDKRLEFTNEFSDLRTEIAKKFPEQIIGFETLCEELAEFDETDLEAPPSSTRKKLAKHLSDQKLIDMLLCPLMYYGNPAEEDMDFAHFAVMWKSIFGSGFCRPQKGMDHIVKLLLEKFKNNGGEIRFNTGVARLEHEGPDINRVTLESGEELTSCQIYSSAGWVETMRMCGELRYEDAGKLGFAELVLYLDTEPKDLGVSDSIIFFNNTDSFEFKESKELLDLSSGVLCCPNNFRYEKPLKEGCVRITTKASYNLWKLLDDTEYKEAKINAEQEMVTLAEKFMPGIKEHITFSDLFTPTTIERYTSHINGAIYGSPTKRRSAKTPYDNLYLIGTDQGFLGIVGALLSGISVANLYGLK